MKRKQKTSTSETSKVITTPTNPTWVDSALQGATNRASTLGASDPSQYVAGPNALQTQAAAGASSLGPSKAMFQAGGLINSAARAPANTYNPALLGQSQAYDAQTYGPSSLLENLQAYMSPYTRDVVDSSLADFDFDAGRTRAQQELALAGNSAVPGSADALTRSLTESNFTRDRTSLAAGLRDQAFTRGTALSADDAGRRQAAAAANAQAANEAARYRADAANQFSILNMGAQNQAGQFNAGQQDNMLARMLQGGNSLAALGQAIGNEQRQNIALQGDLGSQLRAIDQQRAAAPISLAAAETGLLGGLPLNLLHGSIQDGKLDSTRTTTESNPMGALGTLASLALAPMTGGGSLLGNLLGGFGSRIPAAMNGGVG